MTAGRATREQEVPPRASVLVESLRDIGYSLQTAVSDVIDNSLTAGARTIELHAETHAEDPVIGIVDDGTGMTEAELLEAMRPGSRSPLQGRTATDLGRFGLGLKTASFSQCRRLTVVTRKAGVTSCAVWDLDTVAARDSWIVELPESVATIPWSDRLAADGTLVVWQNLDRLVGPDGRGDRRDLVRQLDETARHVEFVFHRFLSGREDREGRVALSPQRPGAEAFRSIPFAPSGYAAPSGGALRARREGDPDPARDSAPSRQGLQSRLDAVRRAGRVREEPGVLPVPESAADRPRHVVRSSAAVGTHETVPRSH